MPNNRDDFTEKTKDRLAKRVGYRCSNPTCRKLTCGASQNPDDYVNIGVAAHICAAAPGGKRYDKNMTAAERKSILNGIWLCQSCSKLIDSDELRYTEKLLYEWKQDAETESVKQLENRSAPAINLADAYGAMSEMPDYRESMRILRMMNHEINELIARMEEIQEKLDAARMDEDGFWIQVYEERLQSMMHLHASMNCQLIDMADKGRMVEHCLRANNSFARKAPTGRKIHRVRPITNPRQTYMGKWEKEKLGDLIAQLELMHKNITELESEVRALHMERIQCERTLASLSPIIL